MALPVARPGRPARITGEHDLYHVVNQLFREVNARLDNVASQLPAHTISKLSAKLVYTSIAAQTCQERTATLLGATTQQTAAASPQVALGNVNLHWSAYVSKANTVTVRVCNITGGAITPNTVKWNISVV